MQVSVRRSAQAPAVGLMAATVLAVLGACAAPPAPLPFKALVPVGSMSVEALGPGLADSVSIVTWLSPPADEPVTIVGQRPAGRDGDDALLDLSVRYQDFPGAGPVAHGRTLKRALPFGGDGVASPTLPLTRWFTVDLDAPRDALARRVHVVGRLYTVDVHDQEGHAGSVVIDLPLASVETIARPPSLSLAVALRSGPADEVFLAAAATPPALRPRAVDQLVQSLATTQGAVREAAFAGLLFLTGETLGRSEYRWQQWWRERRGTNAGLR